VCKRSNTNLGVGDEVDLQQLGLQHGMLGQVRRQGIQQKGRGLTHHVALQEQLCCGVQVQLGRRLCVCVCASVCARV